MNAVIWLKYGAQLAYGEPMGGLEQASFNIARLLKEQVNVTLIGRGRGVKEVCENICFHGIKSTNELDYIQKSLEVMPDADILHCMSNMYYLFCPKTIRKTILHLHTEMMPLLWSSLGKPPSARYSLEEADFIGSQLEDIRRLTSGGKSGADAVIACSRFLSGIWRDSHTNEHVSVIYNFVDLEGFESPVYPREDFILFVGALVPEKGVDTLCEAAAILKRQGVSTPIKVVGSPGIWGRSSDQGFPGSDSIEFTGSRKNTEVLELMKKASVGVIPSTFNDPSPIVAYEFQACGTPVVASNVGGIPEIIQDEKTGVLVPPKNPGALAKEIKRLLTNPKLREEMGRRGRRRLEENFTAELIKPKYLRLYKHLLT
ncbi:MAG: glycosyltransferase family 4 protein [Candidatus Altiarchaeota archaeon]